MQHQTEGTAGRRRILLVEDSYTNQRIATRILERLDYEVELAQNGVLALEAVARNTYDAILMDIMMPEMDGHECTREIRRRFPEPRVPIIALTANAMQGDRERCLEAGADDYLSKPFKGADLAALLARWVSPRPAAVTQEAADDDGVLDTARLEEIGLLGPDADASLSLVDLFRDEARAGIHGIQQALSAQDSERLRQEAHKLKGSAANLGARALAEQAEELQRCGESGDLTRAASLMGVLPSECDRVVAALERIEQRRAA